MPSASMHGMTQAALERRIESVLETVQKPSRYIGGEANQVQKPQATTVVALCYPDAYEVGISNQALQILYQQVNGRTGMAAERVYCPWPDMADAMRREGLPLFTLESWRPVREVDLLGITLQAELTYSNVLEVLDLARIPLRAADRGEGDPIVVAGGPCASNPAPLYAVLRRVLHGRVGGGVRGRAGRRSPRTAGRAARLAALAENPYLYLPGRGRHDGQPRDPHRVRDRDAADRGRRAVLVGDLLARLGRGHARLHPRLPLLPRRDVVPARCASAPPTRSSRPASQQLRCTGYDELSLTSLATSDYTDVVPAIEGIKQRMPDLHLSLPSNRVDTGPVALTAAANARQSSITLAPEAATQRMRDIICKTITDEMIENAIAAAFSGGLHAASRCTS